jgi:hypothetical protein
MAAGAHKTWQSRRLAVAALFFVVLFLILAGVDAGMIASHAEKCPYQFPKWFGCVLANHETLFGGVGALFAAWVA